MSVAFTREEDVEAAAAHLPDRPISPHLNLVTPEGLAALDAALAAARAAHVAAQGTGVQPDRSALARATRDLRYYAARRASAQVVASRPQADVVLFGCTVTILRADARRQQFRIVGEDEADAGRGSISHVSPLARALLGKATGETARLAGGEVEIIAIA